MKIKLKLCLIALATAHTQNFFREYFSSSSRQNGRRIKTTMGMSKPISDYTCDLDQEILFDRIYYKSNSNDFI